MDTGEIGCPGCGELVDVRRPYGVELRVVEAPSVRSAPGSVTVTIGGVVVHECDPHDRVAEAIARRVGWLLQENGHLPAPAHTEEQPKMAEHRVTCRNRPKQPDGHRHIVKVGINAGSGMQTLTVAEVWAAMDDGDRFYTIGSTTGRRTYVEKFDCPCCEAKSLTTRPDDARDDDLDDLPKCK